MKNTPSLRLPGVEPREPSPAQLLARKAYRDGSLRFSDIPSRVAVSKETAKENFRMMQQRMDDFLAAT